MEDYQWWWRWRVEPLCDNYVRPEEFPYKQAESGPGWRWDYIAIIKPKTRLPAVLAGQYFGSDI